MDLTDTSLKEFCIWAPIYSCVFPSSYISGCFLPELCRHLNLCDVLSSAMICLISWPYCWPIPAAEAPQPWWEEAQAAAPHSTSSPPSQAQLLTCPGNKLSLLSLVHLEPIQMSLLIWDYGPDSPSTVPRIWMELCSLTGPINNLSFPGKMLPEALTTPLHPPAAFSWDSYIILPSSNCHPRLWLPILFLGMACILYPALRYYKI